MQSRINNIRQQIQTLRKDDQHVLLVAVSKTCPIEQIELAYNFGIKDFGENKVNELLNKIQSTSLPINWHFIGHLQTNKVKYIVGKVVLIHSVDSIKLLQEIEKESKKKNIESEVLLQINVSGEKTKYGFKIDEINDIINISKNLFYTKIVGLMTMAPFEADTESLKDIFNRLHEKFIDMSREKSDNINMKILSMGMSGDYKEAILSGSNCVRIGSYIFKG
ncbi:MAG: YggS family pyridoxal phosphate enzyme [Candidatus Epulonipiscioides saccharophilum]|nr:MAG: YggS family pyridoxal phosphate enzyme [Epulopiscium sp. AS2M-Bin001]